MKPQKNLTVYEMLISLIKAEEDSIAQIRAMEDEVCKFQIMKLI